MVEIYDGTLRAARSNPGSNLTQAFRPDDVLAIWMPAEMAEYYKEARSSHEIVATTMYSNVRRFHVNTDEKLGKPPGGVR